MTINRGEPMQENRTNPCACGCNRRDFVKASALTATGLSLYSALEAAAREIALSPARLKKEPAQIKAVFLYPPSKTFSDNPDGWWSWPGNEYNAEGRQKQYTQALRKMEAGLGVKLDIETRAVADPQEAQDICQQLTASKPDGLLIIMFYNNSLPQADLLLKTAAQEGIPAVFFIGLGVKHGSINQYRNRPGLYLIQSMDNFEAIESGLRMIHTRKQLSQSLLLSITDTRKPGTIVEPFLGIQTKVIPFAHYADLFHNVEITRQAKDLLHKVTGKAMEIRGLNREALHNALRAYLALTKLIQQEEADAVTMNCLRRGMLKPCLSFSLLNNMLIPATCEDDRNAAYTQMLGQLLIGRPGFQHNPCYETEKNHYYGSHCTCATKVYGPEGKELPYLLRRFAHTNEGSCAIQVFWKEEDPVTMVHYYPGEAPQLDVYAGQVVMSHPMPPAAGCTTNVELKITDRKDVCMVKGHHNILYCGDFARTFRLFARLHKIELVESGYDGRIAHTMSRTDFSGSCC